MRAGVSSAGEPALTPPIGRREWLWGAGATALAACSSRAPVLTGKDDGGPESEPPGPALLVDGVRALATEEPLAVLVRGDRIVSIGPRERIAAAAPAGATVLDGGGGLILPGFNDGHVHVRSGGQTITQAQVEGAETLDEVVARVRRFAEAHPDHAWIIGRGFSYDLVPEGEFPSRRTLDEVSTSRPIYIESYDGHAGWANSAALARAGITASTADPADGRVVREADGRTPAGTLLEGAVALLEAHLPVPSDTEERDTLANGIAHLAALGVTSVNDFATDPRTFERYAALAREGRLPLRVAVSLPLDGELSAYAELRRQHAGDRLRFGWLKGFVDGVIESKTAFMLAPYEGGETRGAPLVAPERLHELVAAAHAHDFRVALHAIGDGAVRLSLDAFEAAARGRPALRAGRHRIEHIEVVHPLDLGRFAPLGVVAAMQPYHAVPSDEPDQGVWSENLGEERRRRSFAWRQLRDAGATLAFGSDWPVMSADPLWGLAVATTRRNEHGLPAAGWNAHQRLSPDEALEAYARGPAVARGDERRLGALAPGMLADLVVLAPGVSPQRPQSLWTGRRVRAVVVGGRPLDVGGG